METELRHPRPDISVSDAAEIARSVYGIVGGAQALVGERDRNFLIDSGEQKFVLKVGNQEDHPQALAAQAEAMTWVAEQDPSLPLARVVPAVNGAPAGEHSGHRLLLTEFIGGTSVRQADLTPGFRRSLGKLVAALHVALAGFAHPALDAVHPWNLTRLSQLRPLLDLVEHRDLVAAELGNFEEMVVPALDRLAVGVVHGDLNIDNFVVDPVDPERIVGLFDFGDIGRAPAVVDLAIAAAYQCLGADPVSVMVQMSTAYHLNRPLSIDEVSLLPDLVAARCVQSLLMSARPVEDGADNTGYLTIDTDLMARTLAALTADKRSEIVEALVMACGLKESPWLSDSEVLQTRKSHMGASYRLSYDHPVRAVSADGVWVIDSDGRRLLDAYNNVPHVGHGHPQVVAAISAQSRRLNTNTRYLVDRVGAYAERLTGLFPEPLSVVLFTNSGSEANDLAYRLASAYSGGTAAITTANAYHGSTTVAAAMSPEEHDISMFEWSVPVDLGQHLRGSAGGVGETLSRVDSNQRIAMVIVDTIFSTEGIYLSPPAMLRTLRDWAHDRGAVLVADEVQAGFGRVGSQFWGFGEVVPDIVTLGKPMGNGYPMGAVVTTAEIADRFAERSTFFSTFAGSPVAAAAGDAVLDVMESERLAAHADEMGGYLRGAITELRHPSVLEVRGAGLFVGVQLESAKLAHEVVEAMRQHGILIGRTGPDHNVLKIRPPLVFQRHHADLLIEQLAGVLA